MRQLEEKILKDGKVLEGGILKVDNFLNHQVDVAFLKKLAQEVYDHYKDAGVTKILTVEASGIPLATLVADIFSVNLLIAKKHKSLNISNNVYFSKVFSFTHKQENIIMVSKEYLHSGERVLIVDDFLANGNAGLGLVDIVRQAGAVPVGISCAIEKSFQSGHDLLVKEGIDVFSLARIKSMSENSLEFVK